MERDSYIIDKHTVKSVSRTHRTRLFVFDKGLFFNKKNEIDQSSKNRTHVISFAPPCCSYDKILKHFKTLGLTKFADAPGRRKVCFEGSIALGGAR